MIKHGTLVLGEIKEGALLIMGRRIQRFSRRIASGREVQSLKENWRKLKLNNMDKMAVLNKVPFVNRLGVIGSPTLKVSEKQILSQLERSLPIRKQYLYIFDLSIDHPRLDIHAVNDRFTLGFDIKIHLSDARAKVFHGAVDLLMGVGFDSEKGIVFLTDPQVRDIRVKGLPDSIIQMVTTVLNDVFLTNLDRLSVYRFEQKSRRQRALKSVLKGIRLGESELILELGYRGATA